MIRTVLSLLVSILFIASCATHTANTALQTHEVKVDGFRGIEWDTPLEQIGWGMDLAGKNMARGIEWYSRKDEDLSIGEARMESIHYVFYQDLFSRVSMVARGGDNYKSLRDHFIAKYGEAGGATENSYTWNLEKTRIMFGYNPSTEVSLLIIQKNRKD